MVLMLVVMMGIVAVAVDVDAFVVGWTVVVTACVVVVVVVVVGTEQLIVQPELSLRFAGHAAPVPACATRTVRVRDCEPAPHVTEHAVHGVHPDTWQSRGHTPGLHGCESDKFGQSDAVEVMVRVRWRPPSPHVTEQGPHCVQSETIQVHAGCEQETVSNSGSHAPLQLAALMSCLLREREPTPHVAEHVDHADHCPTVHGTAQQPLLHVRDSLSTGHAAPPCAGDTFTKRTRD